MDFETAYDTDYSRTFYGWQSFCDDYTYETYGTPMLLTIGEEHVRVTRLDHWVKANAPRLSCFHDEPAANVVARAQHHGLHVFVVYCAEASQPLFDQ